MALSDEIYNRLVFRLRGLCIFRKTDNMKKRREFIKSGITLGATALGFGMIGCKSSSNALGLTNGGDIKSFGIQLYTLRDVIGDDPMGTISQLANMGYTHIESYDGPQGFMWNHSAKEFKSVLDDLGLKLKSSHININEDLELKIDQAAEVGMDYVICPYIGPQTSTDAWKEVTERFNKCGEMCKKAGVAFAYHNHAYSFVPFSGMIPHDFLMANTDPDLVKHQMDIYWVVTGGADPIEYLQKYPNRFKLVHVKDRMKNAGDERAASCDLGTGIIDFPKILKVAEEQGVDHFIVEQERYDNSTPMKSVEVGANYMKKLTFT
jgi:sugar phosphate isomerase/epimerase